MRKSRHEVSPVGPPELPFFKKKKKNRLILVYSLDTVLRSKNSLSEQNFLLSNTHSFFLNELASLLLLGSVSVKCFYTFFVYTRSFKKHCLSRLLWYLCAARQGCQGLLCFCVSKETLVSDYIQVNLLFPHKHVSSCLKEAVACLQHACSVAVCLLWTHDPGNVVIFQYDLMFINSCQFFPIHFLGRILLCRHASLEPSMQNRRSSNTCHTPALTPRIQVTDLYYHVQLFKHVSHPSVP